MHSAGGFFLLICADILSMEITVGKICFVSLHNMQISYRRPTVRKRVVNIVSGQHQQPRIVIT